MELFDIIPDNFFSLLSSKNKRLYIACIFQAFKIYETGSILGVDKKIISDDLCFYLEQNSFFFEKESQKDSDEDEPSNKREIANFVLRRMEECGWIYVDVTNDYVEILNFTDYAITFIEAMMNVYPVIANEDEVDYVNPNEYQGYIYTIYSLLTNEENVEYGILISQVYRNTKLLMRSLRKLDSRLKDYINSVVDTTEIKDLIEKLITYKVELVDNNYAKLKTSDNINKYRLTIVNRLEEIQQNNLLMSFIIKDYEMRYRNISVAEKRANRDIDEMIDAFNYLDELILEIDVKNKTYINSTIGKIKFLLSEDDNVIGKLNAILKFIKNANAMDKMDKAIETVRPLFKINAVRGFGSNSLYTPRGSYSHTESQILDMSRFDFDDPSTTLMEGFSMPYDESDISKFITRNMVDNAFYASNLIFYDSEPKLIMKVIYSVIYACDHGYTVEKLDEMIHNQKVSMPDFIIRKE